MVSCSHCGAHPLFEDEADKYGRCNPCAVNDCQHQFYQEFNEFKNGRVEILESCIKCATYRIIFCYVAEGVAGPYKNEDVSEDDLELNW